MSGDPELRYTWQQAILKRIAYLKIHAFPEKEYVSIIDRQEDILRHNRGYLNWYEWKEYYDIEDQLEQTRIRVMTLSEFRFVLENFGIQEVDVLHTLAHENAHVNIAEQFNATFEGYVLNVSKQLVNGRLAYILEPEADVQIPDNWTDETSTKIAREIVLAPVAYGCELSDGDRKLLARLEP